MTAAPPRPNLLYAHIALNLCSGLSAGARRVGAAVIDHFNHKTGQCDPSIERLATMLGMDRATVMRATESLCTSGFFKKRSHGGKSHRTRYIPQWEFMAEIVDDWNARMKTGEAPSVSKVAETRRSKSQECDVDSRKNATRTVLINRPVETGPSIPAVAGPRPQPQQPPPPETAPRKSKQKKVPAGQYSMLLPIDGGKSQIARSAAERRLTKDLLKNPDNYRLVISEITDEMYNAAVTAEFDAPGTGHTRALHAVQTALAARRLCNAG